MRTALRVLIVEDEPDDAELVVHVLRQSGYEPDARRVETAAAMSDALRTHSWDVILSDNSLPEFDAVRALQLVREHGLDLPFLVISGSIGEDAAIALMKAGAHDYLFKGKLARLGVAVDRELREATSRRERRALSERLELIAKASNDVVYDRSIQTGSIWWNENVFTVFGYAETEPVQALEWFFSRVHEEDLPGLIENFETALAADADAWSGEYRFRRGDGTYAAVLDRSYIVHDRARRPIRSVGAMLDITDRKQLEQQFLQAQKMEAVGRLAGGVAHDFNNILTVITSLSYVIMDELEPDAQARQDVDDVRLAAERGASLTRQLLAFSRKQVLLPVVLDLNTVVSSFEGMLRRVLGENIELVARLAHGLGRVKADQGQLEQVLMNLVVNASDAMPAGGVLTIETSNDELDGASSPAYATVVPGPYVKIVVNDTGIGMDPTTQRRLFEPFFTTKEQGKGTGLGLATVYGIVNQSGGHIRAHSEPGRGSRFEVYLPRVDEAASCVPSRSGVTGVAGGSETILIAEDDPAVRAVTRRILHAGGYCVLHAADGVEALAIAAGHAGTIHLVITDVVMPKMSGRELVTRLKAYGDVRVIFTSGYTGDAIPQRDGPERGMHFVQKPFTPNALLHKVREVLDSGPDGLPPPTAAFTQAPQSADS
jgi:PAS domain S-box-containing protein